MEQLTAVLPFGGTFDLVQLKGSTLKKVFEFSVRRYGQGSGEFLQVSGLFPHLDGTPSPSFSQRPEDQNHCGQVFTCSWTSPNLRGAA